MSNGSEDIFRRILAVFGTSVPDALAIQIPASRCRPEGCAGYLIRPDQMYFTIRLSEMRLAENRQWGITFDPVVLVVAEFDYGGKRVAVPSLIGPELIPDTENAGPARYGSVLENILVAGPVPYRGGEVNLSIRFYRVQRANFVRSILKTLSQLTKLSTSLDEFLPALSIASAVLTSFEGLVGLQGTTCLAAYRASLAAAVGRPFLAQAIALITPPHPLEPAKLWNVDGRLHYGPRGDEPYANSDFVLVNVEGSATRNDLSRLPSSRKGAQALSQLLAGAEGETQAKATLLSGLIDMCNSPDLTQDQAYEVFDEWKSNYLKFKSAMETSHHLGPDDAVEATDQATQQLNEATRLLFGA